MRITLQYSIPGTRLFTIFRRDRHAPLFYSSNNGRDVYLYNVNSVIMANLAVGINTVDRHGWFWTLGFRTTVNDSLSGGHTRYRPHQSSSEWFQDPRWNARPISISTPDAPLNVVAVYNRNSSINRKSTLLALKSKCNAPNPRNLTMLVYENTSIAITNSSTSKAHSILTLILHDHTSVRKGRDLTSLPT